MCVCVCVCDYVEFRYCTEHMFCTLCGAMQRNHIEQNLRMAHLMKMKRKKTYQNKTLKLQGSVNIIGYAQDELYFWI